MKIDQETMIILSRVTIEGNNIFLTCGQLDRKQYLAVNKVLETIGGKWNKKVKAHVYDEDPTEKLETILLTGEIKPPENYGYFPTPPEIAKQIIALADIQLCHSVLEPSAGKGNILKYVPKCAKLDCVELLEDNCKDLQQQGYNPDQADFLEIFPFDFYDRIVANPPFSYKGHPQADIDHVEHMVKFLNPGGRIVSVMSVGLLFRENKKTEAFRDFVNSHGYIERLPDGSFKKSDTSVNTCIIVINQ
jgi:type I restriction-modification system DNA methylase subunit